MTFKTLEAAEECLEEIHDVGTVFRYKHTITEEILYSVYPFSQHIDIFDSPYTENITLIYNGTKWLL